MMHPGGTLDWLTNTKKNMHQTSVLMLASKLIKIEKLELKIRKCSSYHRTELVSTFIHFKSEQD